MLLVDPNQGDSEEAAHLSDTFEKVSWLFRYGYVPNDEATRIQAGRTVSISHSNQKGEPMHLYEINPVGLMPVHVVARSAHEAVDIFVTWSAARGRQQCTFDINRLPIESLRPFQQDQVRSAIAAGLVGICHFDEEIGWTFTPPMWVPLSPDDPPVGDEGASP